MGKTGIVIGTYNGLPAGSTDVEFEQAYERSYKPFLTTLYRYPSISVTLYYSGVLLEWLHDHHPEFLMLVNDMVKRSQVELLGGAFYEPILPLIPTSDRSSQIELLTTYLRKRFGKRPRGVWLPELVWEPSLPASLRYCGMEYTFLDESTFDEAGVASKHRFRPITTEDQGKTIRIYPVHSRLVLSISRLTDDTPSDYLSRIVSACPTEDHNAIVLLDKGEALGLWDSSYEWLYEGDHWLDGVCRAVTELATIQTILPRERASTPIRSDRRYFGCSEAERLMDWWYSSDPVKKELNKSLRKRVKRLIPAGSFRQLLGRYTEAGNLYSKMMHVHILVNQVRGDRYRKRAARQELWKGQSGHAYWHGQIDGIYRRSIRQAAYSSLIVAEKTTREHGIFKPHAGREDFDMDGIDEYLFAGNEINAYVHAVGGVLFELDYLPISWNYLDTMATYEEPYHDVIPHGSFDLSPRRGFSDRIESPDFSFDEYLRGAGDPVGDLSNRIYEVRDYKRDNMEVSLATQWFDLQIEKRYRLDKSALSVVYQIRNSGAVHVRQSFLSNLHLAFASNNEEFLQLRAYSDSGEIITVRDSVSANSIVRLEARDLRNAVTIVSETGSPCDLYAYPLISSWYSRDGPKSGYQCSAFGYKWAIDLAPGDQIEIPLTLRFSH